MTSRGVKCHGIRLDLDRSRATNLKSAPCQEYWQHDIHRQPRDGPRNTMRMDSAPDIAAQPISYNVITSPVSAAALKFPGFRGWCKGAGETCLTAA